MFPDAENARLYGEAHRELTAMWERLTGNPAPADADPATTMLPVIEAPTLGYRYSDPVDDPDWPRIQAATDDDEPDEFPDTWSSEPTQRDQAAIDAGNA